MLDHSVFVCVFLGVGVGVTLALWGSFAHVLLCLSLSWRSCLLQASAPETRVLCPCPRHPAGAAVSCGTTSLCLSVSEPQLLGRVSARVRSGEPEAQNR